MATKKFLDDNGLLYYNQKLQLQLSGKVDKNQGIAQGGKYMAVNETTGLLEPRDVDLTGLVAKVTTPSVVYGTDNVGAQTTYLVDSFGLVNDVLVDGISVVTDKIAEIDLATPLADKQDSLTIDQLAVVNANPFTTTERNKLTGIEAGAEANLINTISVNGTNIPPDVDRNVDITVPTYLTDLNAAGFNYVETIAAGSANVTIGGTAKNPTITVSALEMPHDFTSTETPTGTIGTLLTGMDATALTPILPGTTLALGDNIIFANNIQATVSNIDNNEYDAVITRIPAEVSFAGITGDPMSNTALASALNGKQNTLSIAQQEAVDSGITSTKVSKLDGVESGAQVNVIEGVTLNGLAGTITSKIVNLTIDAVSSSTLASALATKLDVNLGDENAGMYLQLDVNGNVGFSEILAITNSEIDAIMST